MLARRLQALLSVRERAALLRLYFAGSHVQSNPRSHHHASINQNLSSIKTLVPIYGTEQRFGGSLKSDQITSRSYSSGIEDNPIADHRSENGYAHTLLVRSNKDLKSIGSPLETIENVTAEEAQNILGQDWKTASADAVLEAFQKLSCYEKISSRNLEEDKHKDILAALTAKLADFNDEQLRRIYQCCLLWEGIIYSKTDAFAKLFLAMDEECLKRLPNWTPDEAFLICDYLYQLKLTRKLKYPIIVLKKFGKKPNHMNSAHFLHFMFLLNVCRKPAINMYEIEYKMDKILDEFTANELGIMAMAFFKTQTSLRDPKILCRIQMKVLESIDTIHDISLSAIMKVTRYSTGLKDLQHLGKILEEIKPRVPTLAIPCLVHMVHAAAFVQYYNAELMEMIIERFEKDIDKARLKDLERFSWALSIFNYGSEVPIFKKIVETLRDPKRAEELIRYATIPPVILMHLSNIGIFPVDLIKKTLDPEFLDRTYHNNAFKIGWDIFALESNLRTELPEYDGPFLEDGIRQFLAKKYLVDLMAKKTSQVHPSDRLILEAAHMCKLVLGFETAIHIDHILPHFLKPDIIICLDEKNNPVAPEPILSKIPAGTIKRPPPETSNLKWIAIVLGTQNQMIRETNQYIGPLYTKLRQLRKLGYTPFVIPHTDWRDFRSFEAKQNYLRDILPLSPDWKVSAEVV